MTAPDGYWCPECGVHRTSDPGRSCPVCAPTPTRTGPPPRLPLDARHITTTAGEA